MRVFSPPVLSLALTLAGSVACRPTTAEPPSQRPRSGARRARKPTPLQVERARPVAGEPAPVLEILRRELATNLEQLQNEELEVRAYFLGYELIASEELLLVAEDGALLRDELDESRAVDVDLRVGDPELDNSHTREGNYGPGNGLGSGLPISLEDDPLSLAQGLWLDTEAQYVDAVGVYHEIQNTEQLRSDDAPSHPDFSHEEPLVHVEAPYEMDFEAIRTTYREILRDVSTALSDPVVLESNVHLAAVEENRVFVNSEGTEVQSGANRLRVMMSVNGQASDGMMLQRSASFEASKVEELPTKAELLETAARIRTEVKDLRQAPNADPYTGPAILEGRAAGVFFHEIFGHRLEGHRQKDDLEGQTFTNKLGRAVLPRFLDVVDDPTITAIGGTSLLGHYFVDDEGVRSQSALLVDRGRLRGFLLGRSPVLPFKTSNGHGRREPGHQVVARQGNLIVTSRKVVSRGELRTELLAEIERQGKPYGLWFRDIEGGYTITDRSGPQAFKVQPLMVYRVYRDGRPDELVRGVEIVGTPLAAFETILATDDQPEIFNGMCGAESGWVPVSAVSPALLLRTIEIERAAHDRERPPLLDPPPGMTNGAKEGDP